MGAAVYLKLENPEAAREQASVVDGKGVAREWASLNDFAESHGLTPLHDFLSMSHDDVSDLIGDDAVSEASASIPPEKWFEPSKGLQAVEQLLQRIESNGYSLSNAALRDLHSYQEVLEAAARDKVRFHFAFDF
jgi:hypothetical protein